MLQKTNEPALMPRIPVLETPRLRLRKMMPADSGDMYAYACRGDVTEYLLWDPHPSPAYTKAYLTHLQRQYAGGCFFDWAVVLREENKMIGTCGFARLDDANNSGEIGYVFHPDYWGRGLASEAVRMVLKYGFLSLKLQRIEARCMEENERSLQVMKRCGMQYEGTLRDVLYIKGKYRTVSVCAALREDFIRSRSSGDFPSVNGCGNDSL